MKENKSRDAKSAKKDNEVRIMIEEEKACLAFLCDSASLREALFLVPALPG